MKSRTATQRLLRRLAIATLLAPMLPAHAGAAPVPAEVSARAHARGTARVIVTLAVPTPSRRASSLDDALARAGIATAQAEFERRHGVGPAQRPRRFENRPIVAFDASPAQLAALARDPTASAIEADRLMRPALAETIVTAGAQASFIAGIDGSGSAVAILDTGVDRQHPFLGGRVVAEACFSAGGDCPLGGMTESGTDAARDCSYSSECFHGTHVAGIAAGWDANRHGVAPGAGIVAVQIFSRFSGAVDCPPPAPDPCAQSYTSDLIAGMDWVAAVSAVVDVAAVNLSLGGGAYSSQNLCNGQNSATKSSIDDLVALGIVVVAAAGNDGDTNAIHAPACISSAIAVAGIDDAVGIYPDSNSNALVDYFAPGVNVRSSTPGGGFTTANGTSMSTPHVAGAATVLHSLQPGASAADIRLALDAGPDFTDPRNSVTKPRLRLEDAVVHMAPGECFDGIDNDGDGDVDFANDLGCANGLADEGPQCDDGIDNDGDGLVDWDGAGGTLDPGCSSPTDDSEGGQVGSACGAGPELAILLPLLAGLRRVARARAHSADA